MQAVRRWLSVCMLAACMFGIALAKPGTGNFGAVASVKAAPALQSNTIILTGPTACPDSGCYGGQRLSMRFQFDMPDTLIDTSATNGPNVRVCVYATTNWKVSSANFASKGKITGVDYSVPTSPVCSTDASQPADYSLIGESVAAVPMHTPTDAVEFSMHLGIDGTGEGAVIARLYMMTAAGTWTPESIVVASSEMIKATPFGNTTTTAYVANDAAGCASKSPCFLNSDGDEANGVGTGLKDAIDVLPPSSGSTESKIYVIGNYTVKSNPVVVDKKLTITGYGDATITYSGTSDANSCAGYMLSLKNTATLRGLNLNVGNCANTARKLVEIDSHNIRSTTSDTVLLEANDFTSDDNAIVVQPTTTDKVIVRYNQITSNKGFAVYYDGNTTAPLEVTANNITAKGAAIECASGATAPVNTRKGNHNYWSNGVPAQNTTHCIIDPAKRLGAPIAPNSDVPGVRAALVTVTSTKTYADQFDKRIAYKRSGTGGNDFNMYIVDYGYMTGNTPFSYQQGGRSPSPCSNYWDVFVADGAAVNNTLELYFKYFNENTLITSCQATIDSAQFCGQTTTPAKYPLYWLDPSANSVTNWWDLAGAIPSNLTSGSGQTIACDTSSNVKEIQLSIDNSGRPNLADLGYTPFMVGIPVIKDFQVLASNQTVNISWTTNAEPDIKGFNILWSTDGSVYSPWNGDLYLRTGTFLTGSTYNKTQSGLTNGQKLYYRLEVVRTDGKTFYSEVKSVTVNPATPIPSTPTRTWTPVLPTRTPTFTLVPSSFPTQPLMMTPTLQLTGTPTPTLMSLPTLTETLDPEDPVAAVTLTALAGANSTPTLEETGTPIAMVGSTTPEAAVSGTPVEVVAGAATISRHPWLSLLLGLLAGLALVGGAGGWWYYTIRK